MNMGNIVIASTSRAVAKLVAGRIPGNERGSVFITTSENELVQRVRTGSPRLLLLEDCFSGILTTELLTRLLKRHPRLRIAVFAVDECHPFTAARFLCWGAESFISLRDEEEKVREAVNKIVRGGIYYPDSVGEIAEQYDALPTVGTELTKREREVLRLSVSGKKIRDIAEELHLQPKTVRNHRANIYVKVNGNTIADMISYGIKKGILDYGEIGKREKTHSN